MRAISFKITLLIFFFYLYESFAALDRGPAAIAALVAMFLCWYWCVRNVVGRFGVNLRQRMALAGLPFLLLARLHSAFLTNAFEVAGPESFRQPSGNCPTVVAGALHRAAAWAGPQRARQFQDRWEDHCRMTRLKETLAKAPEILCHDSPRFSCFAELAEQLHQARPLSESGLSQLMEVGVVAIGHDVKRVSGVMLPREEAGMIGALDVAEMVVAQWDRYGAGRTISKPALRIAKDALNQFRERTKLLPSDKQPLADKHEARYETLIAQVASAEAPAPRPIETPSLETLGITFSREAASQ